MAIYFSKKGKAISFKFSLSLRMTWSHVLLVNFRRNTSDTIEAETRIKFCLQTVED